MARMTLKTFVADKDKLQATIELWMDDKPLGHIQFDASELEGFIHAVAGERAKMADEVPRELDPNVRLVGTDDPVWRAYEAGEQGSVLSLRHPGLGWLSFRFPGNEARSLANALLAESE